MGRFVPHKSRYRLPDSNRPVGTLTAAAPSTSPLVEQLEAGSARDRVVRFVTGSGIKTSTWAAVHDAARRQATWLQRSGVEPGDRLAVLGETDLLVVTAIEAVWLAGGVPVVLPVAFRGMSETDFLERTESVLRHADAGTLLYSEPFRAIAEANRPATPVALSQLEGLASTDDLHEPEADGEALLQYTSGSTGLPRGVVLEGHAVAANLGAIRAGLELQPDKDVIVSWLPLYHDMGLLGMLALAMTTGTELVIAPPSRFIANPREWSEWIAAFHGTVTCSPNFGYGIASRWLKRGPALNLGSLRIAINGAEPIDPATVEAYVAAGAAHGLSPRVPFCVYGLAEASLAVTFPEPHTGMAVDEVSTRSIERDRVAGPPSGTEGVTRLAKVGWPLAGVELRCWDAELGELPSRHVGEVCVRGDSMLSEYRHETGPVFDGSGWFHTGDLGYLTEDGQLVICGRSKDIIIVGGRNISPESVERAAADVPGVRYGNVVAFGWTEGGGREHVGVVAETDGATAGVAGAIRERVRESVGVTVARVDLVEPRTLPKTTSGKPRRAAARAAALDHG